MKKFTLITTLFICGFLASAGLAQARKPPIPQEKPARTIPTVIPQTVPDVQPAATAVTSGQNMQDALQNAYVNNPTLQAARAQLKATQELLPQALSNWQPDINAGASATETDLDSADNTASYDSTFSKDVNVSFQQPVYRGGRTMAESAAARYTIEAQKAALSIQEQQTLLEAATAYMDVLRDQALLDLSENNHDVISKQKEVTRERFTVGELTKTDMSQAEARLAQAESNVITAQGNLRSSMAVYQRVIGLPPTSLSAPHIPLSLPDTAEDAIAKAENENPSVLAAIYVHKAAEKDVDNVFGELLPDVSVFGSIDKTWDPSPGLVDDLGTNAIGISATVPLYEGGGTRSRVRQAKYVTNKRYLEILDARRQAHEQAVTNWEALQTARAEIRSRQSQVEAEKVAQEGVHAEAEYGTRTVLDALDADQETLDAEVALVIAQRNEIVAQFSLAATLGELSPVTLGFAQAQIDAAAPERHGIGGILDMDVDRVGETQ